MKLVGAMWSLLINTPFAVGMLALGLVLPMMAKAAFHDDTPKHWAYIKPAKPSLPVVRATSWPRNAIDYLILARLEHEGLQPSPEADLAVLLRRVYLDLIGIPPTPAQAGAFLRDPSPRAYEKAVDSLLSSPQYGERWGRHWLDLARYADSNGFQRDGFRDLWAYRDWVIQALNADMPFDQFTLEQLAGDLLPNATLDQKIATGFHRCSTVNVEAGTDQEENRVNQVIDRVKTTGTVWLGTTIECAQCHDHKYDPITQKEYYQLFAFFNNTEIETRFRSPKATAAIDFVGPTIELPDQNQHRRDALQSEADRLAAAISHFPRATTKSGAQASTNSANSDPELKPLKEQHEKAVAALKKLSSPQTLVMKELSEPRPTTMFIRGNFLEKGEPVQASTPAALHALEPRRGVLSSARDGILQPLSRLDLARWLVHDANPLMARVTVNRWWAEFFGHGIVRTLEDFGSQGDRPSHPELLDWLGVEFMETGWSMKAVHRLIVMSSTYRQSSKVMPELLVKDDQNRLYARGARFRMDAETIRDNALFAAGLLSLKMGGPPVKPYQPPAVWTVTGLVDNTYQISEGTDRYRRGVYIIWRRSAPYPSFVNFDAPVRASCVVKRSRSNTPLQALTLLNDPVYVEAAMALAKRIVEEQPNGTVNDRIQYAFRVCLTRSPKESEISALAQLFQEQLARFRQDPTAAQRLVNDFPNPSQTDLSEFAAWYHIAVVLLNLDEMVTKG